MNIDFFSFRGKFDNRAITSGVYKVDLINSKKSTPLCLYIGESVWMASRCGRHLFALKNNPDYFGLTDENMQDECLTLKFSVVEVINTEKKNDVKLYKEKELDAIQKYKPLTQGESSDKQSRNKSKKVQEAIEKWE